MVFLLLVVNISKFRKSAIFLVALFYAIMRLSIINHYIFFVFHKKLKLLLSLNIFYLIFLFSINNKHKLISNNKHMFIYKNHFFHISTLNSFLHLLISFQAYFYQQYVNNEYNNNFPIRCHAMYYLQLI